MLRELAHLQEQLGDERFAALIDSGNTGKVKEFCDGLVKDAIPTTMTIGGRTYDIIDLLQEGEVSMLGASMVERAEAIRASLGQEDGQHLLDHQQEIPEDLLGKVSFVFPGWRDPDDSEKVAYIRRQGRVWTRSWTKLVCAFDRRFRLLRRRK